MVVGNSHPQHFPDIALVIEGGGMRNAYSAAFIDQLIRRNIHLGWVGGVSAGASHTVNYLSRDRYRTVASFVDFAADRNFGGVTSFLRGQGYFNASYIYEIAPGPDQPHPYDFETFASNPTPFSISALRADTGETVYWGREDTPDLNSLLRRVRASSTMPGFMPMPIIDGIPYVDGAVGETGGLMLQPAIDAGFTRFIVVASRPRSYWRSKVSRAGLLTAASRRFPEVARAAIARPDIYNATKQQILDLEADGRAYVFFPENLTVENTENNVHKLRTNFESGLNQTRREWPRVMEFLRG